ncbi:MAG: dTDP-4-dehydrorhamnose 3,5-epimerase [Candidatus Omnitrophica bacterium]|nr:dTDP-4-dehydrorhamnose 3,5-epimerase [Candidatus Omnitrophota bacterium]
MPFNFKKTEIPEIILIEPQIFSDKRGVFLEICKHSEFKRYGLEKPFCQVNHSRSIKNVLRGLHYQLAPQAQAKLVHVVSGEIFDVGVDLRRHSATYGHWVGEILSSQNRKMLYIPEGFAHGFCVISDIAEVIYHCTAEYSQEHDRGIIWSDKMLDIQWPIKNPILSDKDLILPTLAQSEHNL